MFTKLVPGYSEPGGASSGVATALCGTFLSLMISHANSGFQWSNVVNLSIALL